MPVVNIPGLDKPVTFPDSMSLLDIQAVIEQDILPTIKPVAAKPIAQKPMVLGTEQTGLPPAGAPPPLEIKEQTLGPTWGGALSREVVAAGKRVGDLVATGIEGLAENPLMGAPPRKIAPVGAVPKPNEISPTLEPRLERVLTTPPVQPSNVLEAEGSLGPYGVAVVRGLEGLTSPLSLAAIGTMGAAGAAVATASPGAQIGWAAADTTLGAYFAGSAAVAGYEQGKVAWDALQSGKMDEAATALGFATVDALTAWLAARHSIGLGRDMYTGYKWAKAQEAGGKPGQPVQPTQPLLEAGPPDVTVKPFEPPLAPAPTGVTPTAAPMAAAMPKPAQPPAVPDPAVIDAVTTQPVQPNPSAPVLSTAALPGERFKGPSVLGEPAAVEPVQLQQYFGVDAGHNAVTTAEGTDYISNAAPGHKVTVLPEKGGLPASFSVQAPIKVKPGETQTYAHFTGFPDLSTAKAVSLYLEDNPKAVKALSNRPVEEVARIAWENGRPYGALELQTQWGPVSFVDDSPAKHITHAILGQLQGNEAFTNLAGLQIRFAERISQIAKAEGYTTFSVVNKIAPAFAGKKPVYGYFQPKINKLVLNPIATSYKDPGQAAEDSFLTIVHELIHGEITGHAENFSLAEEHLLALLSADRHGNLKRSMEMEIDNAIRNPARPGEIHPDLLEAAELLRPGSRGKRGTGTVQATSRGQAATAGGEEAAGPALARDMEETSGVPGPTFYNLAERVIDSNVGDKGIPRDSVLNLLKRHGVRDEEIKWSGLKTWLDMQPGGRLAKEAVIGYLKEAQVKVTVKELGSGSTAEQKLAARSALINDLRVLFPFSTVLDIEAIADTALRLVYAETYPLDVAVRTTALTKALIVTTEQVIGAVTSSTQHLVASAKYDSTLPFSGYTTPGGRDYGITLFQLPGETILTEPHFNEPNVLVHTRYKIHDLPEGSPFLLLDEIQSNLMQEGRDKGWRDETVIKTLRQEHSELETFLIAEQGYGTDDLLANNGLRKLNLRIIDEQRKLPPVPFSETYYQLAFKWSLRAAVDRGLAGLGWTKGVTQVERYEEDYRARVDSIEVQSAAQNTKQIDVAYGDERITLFSNQLGNIIHVESPIGFKNKSLSEIFGPAVATKILAGQPVIEGPDLTIGGEGMKQNYDVRYKNWLERYVAQWGMKVETVAIDTAPGKTQDIWFTRFSDKMIDSVLNDGQPQFRDLPEEATKVRGELVQARDDLNMDTSLPDLLEPEAVEHIGRGIDAFTYRQKMLTTMHQLAQEFPDIKFFQDYATASRLAHRDATVIKAEADMLLKSWRALGAARSTMLDEFFPAISFESHKQGRRLSQAEVVAKARAAGLDKDQMRQYWLVDEFLGHRIDDVKAALVDEATNRLADPAKLAKAVAEIDEEFRSLKNRNYWPFQRFGKHAVLVKANVGATIDGVKYRKNSLIAMEAYESEADQMAALADLQRLYAGEDVQIAMDLLPDSVQQLSGMPPSVIRNMTGHLNLSADQVDNLNQLAYSMLPGRSWAKHMLRRRGIRGWSTDSQRVFAKYSQGIANNIGRLRHRFVLERAIDEAGLTATATREAGNAVPTRKLQFWMQEHYAHAMNPGQDYAALRGLMFAWSFWAVPKQAIVNLTQVPLFTMPYLAKALPGSGPLESSIALTKALKDFTRHFGSRVFRGQTYTGPFTRADFEVIQALTQDGTLDQGFATELAALSHGEPIQALIGERRYSKVKAHVRKANAVIRGVMDTGLWAFSGTEKLNRYVTALAASRMARKRGMAGGELIDFTRTAIDNTQVLYAQYNRIPLFRGKPGESSWAPTLGTFRTFSQNALYTYGALPEFGTNAKGSWFSPGYAGKNWARFLLLMSAGLIGLPFAKDIIDILDASGTGIKRLLSMKNPKVDIKKEMREMLKGFGQLGDVAEHGLMSHFLGFDVSESIGMGKVIPGVEPVTKGLLDTMEPEKAMLRTAQEVVGVAGAAGVNLSDAFFEWGAKGELQRKALPRAVQNGLNGLRAMQQGYYSGPTDKPILKVDPEDPRHIAEVVGTMLGFKPTRLRQAQEVNFEAFENVQYYEAWREAVFTTAKVGLLSKDPDMRKTALDKIVNFNGTAPIAFHITLDAVIKASLTQAMDKQLLLRGLPLQEKYLPLYREYQGAYQSQSETPPSQPAESQYTQP